MDEAEKAMIAEMYKAYKVQCKFLQKLVDIHEEWDRSEKSSQDAKGLLDKVHVACQGWRKARQARGEEIY